MFVRTLQTPTLIKIILVILLFEFGQRAKFDDCLTQTLMSGKYSGDVFLCAIEADDCFDSRVKKLTQNRKPDMSMAPRPKLSKPT